MIPSTFRARVPLPPIFQPAIGGCGEVQVLLIGTSRPRMLSGIPLGYWERWEAEVIRPVFRHPLARFCARLLRVEMERTGFARGIVCESCPR